jgi:hypothetical protein
VQRREAGESSADDDEVGVLHRVQVRGQVFWLSESSKRRRLKITVIRTIELSNATSPCYGFFLD